MAISCSDWSHECIDIAVDHGISGAYVVRVLDQAACFRGYPRAEDVWHLAHIRPSAESSYSDSGCSIESTMWEDPAMGKKKVDQSKTDVIAARSLGPQESALEWKSEIPDFTPEQWAWLKEQSHRFEMGYVPTRSLIAAL